MKILILEGLHGENKGKKMQWRLKRTDLKVGDRVVLDCHDWKVIKIIDKPKKKKRKVFWDYGSIACRDWVENIDTLRGIKYVIEQVNKRKLAELHNRPYFKTIVTEVKGKPRRGENLGKIGFPCYCSFRSMDIEYKGQINIGWDTKTRRDIYELFSIDQQYFGGAINRWGSSYSLKGLMDKYDIEILKGELHLWKEVE